MNRDEMIALVEHTHVMLTEAESSIQRIQAQLASARNALALLCQRLDLADKRNDQIKLPALSGLLKVLEWSGQGRRYDTGSYAKVCPICRQTQPFGHDDDFHRPWMGHTEDCVLAAALRELAAYE